jgi:hypothetical protein
MPSTNEEDVMAIKPRIDGIRYLTNVGKISPLRASLSLFESIVIVFQIYALNKNIFILFRFCNLFEEKMIKKALMINKN